MSVFVFFSIFVVHDILSDGGAQKRKSFRRARVSWTPEKNVRGIGARLFIVEASIHDEALSWFTSHPRGYERRVIFAVPIVTSYR